MLSSFTIENFKSYRKATLKLAPLTVLIGANASGKSNAIEALRLLSWIAAGNKLGSIRRALQETERKIRGTVHDLGSRGKRAFSLSCKTTEPDWDHYSIALEVRDHDDLHIVDERVTGPASYFPLFKVATPSTGDSGDMQVAYNNFVIGGRKPRLTCSDQTAVLCQFMSSARFESGHKKAQNVIPTVTHRFHLSLSDVTFVDPRPSVMRGYSLKSEKHLNEDGNNLSGVLYNLCRSQQGAAELLDFIRALPEQNIKEIDFIPTPRGELMVTLTESFGKRNRKYDATLLSDGTIRVLAIGAAVLSAPPGLVVIEEFDNGVHPNRAGQLLTQVSRIAKERDLRVLISSHNPALLDALPDDAIPDVVFCYRSVTDGLSRLVRLEDVPDYPELLAQGSVGHLMTRGIIERFVKDHPGSEQKKQRAHAWLNELRKQAG